jgi:hypothetical protein
MVMKKALAVCDDRSLKANPKNLPAGRSAPAFKLQALDWADPVSFGNRIVGFVIRGDEGQAAFDVSGALIGVFQRRGEAVTAVPSGRIAP